MRKRKIRMIGYEDRRDLSEIQKELLDGRTKDDEKKSDMEKKVEEEVSSGAGAGGGGAGGFGRYGSSQQVQASSVREYLKSLVSLDGLLSSTPLLVVIGGIIYALAYGVSKEQEEGRFYNQTYEVMEKYADTDKDGKLSFDEQAKAWKRMGFDGVYVESRGEEQFEKPSVEQLERVIKSYQYGRGMKK